MKKLEKELSGKCMEIDFLKSKIEEGDYAIQDLTQEMTQLKSSNEGLRTELKAVNAMLDAKNLEIQKLRYVSFLIQLTTYVNFLDTPTHSRPDKPRR